MEAERRYRLVKITSKLRLVRSRRHQSWSRTGPDSASHHRPAKKKGGCGGKRRGRRKEREAVAWLAVDTLATFLLYVLGGVVAVQVYSGEDPDEVVAAYELGHLERMLHGELVGQNLAVQRLSRILRGYLSTSWHAEPLLLSVHGPRGVGKSFLGTLLSKHFKSTLEPEMVYLHSVLHHPQGDASSRVPATLSRARNASRIPFLLFDHMEHASPKLLGSIGRLLTSGRSGGAVFVLLSGIGGDIVARRSAAGGAALARLAKGRHPLWAGAHFVALLPLDLPHVVQCVWRAMERAGFYPGDPRAEDVAGALTYYRAGRRFFSRLGCKPVPSMVRKLKARPDLPAKGVVGNSGQFLHAMGRGSTQNIQDHKKGEQK